MVSCGGSTAVRRNNTQVSESPTSTVWTKGGVACGRARVHSSLLLFFIAFSPFTVHLFYLITSSFKSVNLHLFPPPLSRREEPCTGVSVTSCLRSSWDISSTTKLLQGFYMRIKREGWVHFSATTSAPWGCFCWLMDDREIQPAAFVWCVYWQRDNERAPPSLLLSRC